MKCGNLDVLKRACAINAEMYIHFKSSQDYGFEDSITRCGLSTASDIAEEIERYSNKETKEFVKGKIAEYKKLMESSYE